MSFPLKASTLAVLAVAASLGVAGCGGSSGVDHLAVWTADNTLSCPAGVTKADATCFYSVIAGTEAVGLSVAAVDADNRLVRDYTGTWSFSSTDGAAGLPGSYTLKTDDYGTKDFNILISQAGTFTVTVKDAAGHTGTVKLVADALEPAIVTSYAQSKDDTGAAIKNTIDLTVHVQDQAERDIPNYTGTLTFTGASLPAGATLPTIADYTYTADDAGVHKFKAVGPFPTGLPGPKYTITATDTVNSALTASAKLSFLETGAPSSKTRILVTGPANATVGTPVTLTATVLDKYNQVYVVAADGTHYVNTITVTSSDTLTRVPAAYTFVEGDNSATTFPVTFYNAGSMTVTVTGKDGATGSIKITAAP